MKLIFSAITGSHLYGTNTPLSDKDICNVYVEDLNTLFGLTSEKSIKQEIIDGVDYQKHYLKNFLKLCLKGNPNTLEPLFSNQILHCDPLFAKYFLSIRSRFLGLLALKGSHFGFANQQIKKMEIYASDRGADRKALIDKYGYDVKYFAHAIRLIWQLEYICRNHELKFPLSNDEIDNLKTIKAGRLSHQAAHELWGKESKRIEAVVTSNITHLQEVADFKSIQTNCCNFYTEYYFE